MARVSPQWTDDAKRRFGLRLRQLREAKGFSLGILADRTHYNKGYLSKIENGIRPPSEDVARFCDGVLETDGELLRLLRQMWPVDGSDHEGVDAARWVGPRDPLLDSSGLPYVPSVSTVAAPRIDDLWRSFEDVRRAGRTMSPALVWPKASIELHLLDAVARSVGGARRNEVLRLSSRVADFIGWMAQEAGNESAAMWWTDRAADYAAESGDLGMTEYVDVRRALIRLYHGDADAVVALAGRVRLLTAVAPRIRWLAAQREAQGYALAGDLSNCLRTLESARELGELIDAEGGAGGTGLPSDSKSTVESLLGPGAPVDRTAMVTGWCAFDLGRFDHAAAVLDHEVPRIPATAVRERVRFGVRRALAHAARGDVDTACLVFAELLTDAAQVDSATIRADLRALARALARHTTHSKANLTRQQMRVLLREPGVN